MSQKGKLSKFQRLFDEIDYLHLERKQVSPSVQLGIAIYGGIYLMRNLLKEMEFMPGATLVELKNKAVEHALEILGTLINIPNITGDVMISTLCNGIRIAVLGDGVINEKERTIIKEFFDEMFNDIPIETFIELINRPLDEDSYKIVTLLFDMSTTLGMQFCNFIMCFAYVDGVFEDEVSQKLSDIVTSNVNVFAGTPEDFLNSLDEEE